MKQKRNAALVEELMERTFAMRQREIIENSCDVKTLFKKFPFLQDPEQVTVAANCMCYGIIVCVCGSLDVSGLFFLPLLSCLCSLYII